MVNFDLMLTVVVVVVDLTLEFPSPSLQPKPSSRTILPVVVLVFDEI